MPRLLSVPQELAPIASLLGETMGRVERTVTEVLASELPPVNRLAQHVSAYHGKMIRPMLVTLFGLAARPAQASEQTAARDSAATTAPGGPLPDALVTLGAVVEMVHLATLVHDDVLDEADERRRTVTVNRLVGNEAAVMLGDYLFSAAYRLCGSLGDAHATVRIGQTGMTLCAGELLQLHNRGNFSLDEATYFALIDRKTASLISVSCELGARAGDAGEAQQRHAARFGSLIGAAFQVQDDLLDLAGDQALVGKTLGKDAEKGKLTLPVIHHLACADAKARTRTLALLSATAASEHGDRAELAALLGATGSIDYAQRRAKELVAQATQELEPLPDGPAKAMLRTLAGAVVERGY
jgi:octaprenyl-diphosphate synthase